MKYLFILAGVVCLSFMLLPACAPQPEEQAEPELAPEPVFDQAAEEAAIREVIKKGFATWNQHDVKAHMAVYVDDYESWAGDIKGQAAWEEYFTEFWNRQKDSQVHLNDEIGIIFVTSDVAIFKAHGEYTGLIDEEGKPQPPSKWMGAWVLSKSDGKWLVSAIFTRDVEE